MKFRIIIISILVLIGSTSFALNLSQDITTRKLTKSDEAWILREFPRSLMEVYQDKIFVITKEKRPVLLGKRDITAKQEWLLDTAKEEFKDYVLTNNQKYQAIGIIQKNQNQEKLIGAVFYQLHNHGTLYIAQYFIIPELQKQGVGYYVINAILPKLHPEYKNYEVLTRQQNDAAISLYNKLGFTIGDIALVTKYGYDPLRYMSFYKNLDPNK